MPSEIFSESAYRETVNIHYNIKIMKNKKVSEQLLVYCWQDHSHQRVNPIRRALSTFSPQP